MVPRAGQSAEIDIWIDDPAPTTPFEVVDEFGLLRLRSYEPGAAFPEVPPVLLVYPAIKRPYIVDLLPDRSIVRSLLRKGLNVYLTDWVPPGRRDSDRGIDDYVNRDLANAVDVISARHDGSRVALIGICCGGLFGAVFAALHPERVSHLMTLATPFEVAPPVGPLLAEQIASAWGNVPAWMVGSVMNSRMWDPHQMAFQLASDLGEPDLSEAVFEGPSELARALKPWLGSDVPLAGRLFLDVVRDALPNANLLEGRMRVGGRKVDPDRIECPVLVVAGERDTLVPAKTTQRFSELVGSSDARRLIFPTGHLGLMLSRAAHAELWPDVAAWIQRRRQPPLRQTA